MITIGFSRHKGFAPLSWLIMLCEKTKFSHTYLKVHAESLDRDLIYQATGSGVYFIGRQLFESTNIVIEEFNLELPKEAKTILLRWAVDNSGKSYGRLQLLGIGIIRLFKLFGKRIKNPFSNGPKSYVCCELVVAALELLSKAPPQDLDMVDLDSTFELVKQAAQQII